MEQTTSGSFYWNFLGFGYSAPCKSIISRAKKEGERWTR